MTLQHSNFEERLASGRKADLSRPLYINFDLYTEGDPEYKKELGSLIIENLREFRQTLPASIQQDNPTLFLQACHKAQVTLSMLEDKEFNKLIEALEKDIVNVDKDSHFIARSKQFQNICDLIITSLTMELNDPES